MTTKFIFALKALEKDLDRQTKALLEEAPTTASREAMKQKISTAYLQLARRMSIEGDIEDGLALCRKAVQLKPDNLDANYFILSRLEKLNRVDEAWIASNMFEDKYGSLYDISKKMYLVKALLEYRRGNLEIACEMQERFLEENPLHSLQAKVYGELGKTLDRLGRYDAAIKAFHVHNKNTSNTPDGIDWTQKSNDALDNLETSLRWYKDKNSFGWERAVINDPLAAPVLLVGFPRSGTTLLDQILNSHSALTTIEEKWTLKGLTKKFYGSDDKLTSLSLLNSDNLAANRQLYWSNVESLLDKPLDKSTLVDKLPLNIRYLDIFARLFPEVKIIVALRDPRDVVLSNYMQVYKLSPEMATSLTLADSARFYAKVMELYLLFRKFIPDNIHEIRYEDLVCDFKGESIKLLDFLGLKWDNNLMQYHENAKKRWINTPSYDQVTKPIYHDAVGRWRNYETHLQEIMPVLRPYIETFGYST